MRQLVQFLNIFRLADDRDDYENIVNHIRRGITFRGTNLWVLVFAIIIASVGLNMNSTAVIIGAMLISPLMGPIMGAGLALGINDFNMIKNALRNLSYAVLVSIASSALYFTFSPMKEATSEILARTTPNFWDVMIALAGGMAGIITLSSKEKGNILPGVAIATALMPPLCTAGYGLATFQWNFFLGALYLFMINSVCISFATLVTVRFLKFPLVHYTDAAQEKKVRRWVYFLLAVTITPSIYIGYRIVQQNKFIASANQFIKLESTIGGNYLLDKVIDPTSNTIILTYGGIGLTEEDKQNITTRLENYNLKNVTLEFKEGFVTKNSEEENQKEQQYLGIINKQELEISQMNTMLDSINSSITFNAQFIREAKAIYPDILSISIAPVYDYSSENSDSLTLAFLQVKRMPSDSAEINLSNWFQTKLSPRKVHLVFDPVNNTATNTDNEK